LIILNGIIGTLTFKEISDAGNYQDQKYAEIPEGIINLHHQQSSIHSNYLEARKGLGSPSIRSY
jgi:hypothetical protein